MVEYTTQYYDKANSEYEPAANHHYNKSCGKNIYRPTIYHDG